MTAKQLSTALTRLGFNQTSFAALIGVSSRMVRNWVAGEWPVPTQTALLVNLMLKTDTHAASQKLENLKS